MAQNLSEREQQVLELATQGHIDDSIASKLEISVATVRGYWLRIRSKLGGSSRAELVGKWVTLRSDRARESKNGQLLQDILDTEAASDAALALEREEMDKILAGLPSAKRKQIEEVRKLADENRKTARGEEASVRSDRDRK